MEQFSMNLHQTSHSLSLTMDSPPAILRPPLPSPSAGGSLISDSSPLLPLLTVLPFIGIVILIYAFYALRCPPNPFDRLQRRSGESAGGLSRRGDNGQRADRMLSSVAYEKESHGRDSGGECPVCLAAFSAGEVVRQVNLCKHLFHAPCIDAWLASHSSCPVCRAIVATAKHPKPRPVEAEGENDLRQGLPDSASLV